jgi:hypothetical protein
MRKKQIIEERDAARALAKELMPFLEDYIRFGQDIGEAEDGHDSENCYDCQVRRKALDWQSRIDSGEIAKIMGDVQ